LRPTCPACPCSMCFFFLAPPLPGSTLFPYTTLFRSGLRPGPATRREPDPGGVPLAGQPGAELLIGPGGESDRRGFFRDTLGRLLREVVARTEERVAPRRYFRPPGALPEVAFVAACTRCGACIDVCPVHAIVTAPAGAGLAAGTPVIDMARQACVVW